MELKVKSFDELTSSELYEILRVRAQIFIVERGMRCQDLDGVDQRSLHLYLEEDGKIAAYLRAYTTEDGGAAKIGRVLTVTHGAGLGRRLIEESIPKIREALRADKIIVDAQKHAKGFYEKLGFEATSDEFIEEGVVHVAMVLYRIRCKIAKENI